MPIIDAYALSSVLREAGCRTNQEQASDQKLRAPTYIVQFVWRCPLLQLRRTKAQFTEAHITTTHHNIFMIIELAKFVRTKNLTVSTDPLCAE